MPLPIPPEKSTRALSVIDLLTPEEFGLIRENIALGITVNEPPPVIAITKLRKAMEKKGDKEYNKYQVQGMMCDIDPTLDVTIRSYGAVIGKMFGNFKIRAGSKMESKERKVLKTANDFARNSRLRRLATIWGKKMLKHGDAITEVVVNDVDGVDEKGKPLKKGVTEISHLPLEIMSIRNSRGDIPSDDGNTEAMDTDDPNRLARKSKSQVWKRGAYVMNEDDPKVREILDPEEVIHLSMDPTDGAVVDILGRTTFNVWSKSPIAPLETYSMWKANIIQNDILIRHKVVPRYWHQCDLQAYQPRFFGGNQPEGIEAARVAAVASLAKYRDTLQNAEADQDFITGLHTQISVVEPKATTYMAPNEQIQEINNEITTAGSSLSATRGGETYASAYMAAIFSIIAVEDGAEEVFWGILELTKRHLRATLGDTYEKEIDKLEVKFNVIMDQQRAELAKIVTALAETYVFTQDEIREFMGSDPATDEDKKEIKEYHELRNPPMQSPLGGGGGGKESGKQVARDLKNKPATSTLPKYPSESRQDRLKTVTKRDKQKPG